MTPNEFLATGAQIARNTYQPAHLVTVTAVLCGIVAIVVYPWLPSYVPSLPAVTPSLALSLPWIFYVAVPAPLCITSTVRLLRWPR